MGFRKSRRLLFFFYFGSEAVKWIATEIRPLLPSGNKFTCSNKDTNDKVNLLFELMSQDTLAHSRIFHMHPSHASSNDYYKVTIKL